MTYLCVAMTVMMSSNRAVINSAISEEAYQLCRFLSGEGAGEGTGECHCLSLVHDMALHALLMLCRYRLRS
jgi:hypothetical protein